MPPKKKQATKEQVPAKATVGGHQGHWVPFSERLVSNEVWSEKKCPRDAWRVLWWLSNRMTGNVKYEDDDNIYGVVANGNTVSFKEIASDLHCHWSSVQRSMDWLVNHKLVARERGGKGQEYCYQVMNSLRQFELQTITGDSAPETFNLEDEDDEIDFEDKPVTTPAPSPVTPDPPVKCPMPHCIGSGPASGMEAHVATRKHLCKECRNSYHTGFEKDECENKHIDEYNAEMKDCIRPQGDEYVDA
jgi:hypothetical protein